MNKKLKVGQRWVHFKNNGKDYAVFEITDILDDGEIEDAIVYKTKGYKGIVGLVDVEFSEDNYFTDADMKPLYTITPLYRVLND